MILSSHRIYFSLLWLFACHSNLDELLKIVNHENEMISSWLKINKLSLNVNKSHYIIFHNRQKKISLG